MQGRCHFVPKSKKVLLSSTLLQPREIQKLSFIAPTKPGVYPYVCTYPGHWMRMHGALYVVDNLDNYLANPEAYLAEKSAQDRRSAPLRNAVTEWKLEDLAAEVQGLKPGRSYGNGKAMFKVASCVACHRLEGEGNEFGPDLSNEAKITALISSRTSSSRPARINEKYQTWVITTNQGKTYTGLILEETPKRIKLIENPLAKAEPIFLLNSDIDSKQKSPISIMPKGLLDKLTRDEILDLIAYLSGAAIGSIHCSGRTSTSTGIEEVSGGVVSGESCESWRVMSRVRRGFTTHHSPLTTHLS